VAITTVPALVLVAAGCGLPGDTGARVVEDSTVPYRLLETDAPTGLPGSEGPVRPRQPVVFWASEDERLAPAAVAATCDAQTEVVVERVLEVLGAGPDEDARASGQSSAVPTSSALVLVEVVDGVATVALDPATPIPADRLPLAVGQVVLSVTSAPGVSEVLVSVAGAAVQVPLPGGELTSGPVSADDYAELVPDRYQDASAEIGCPEGS
jgi:spore germination protein GerM